MARPPPAIHCPAPDSSRRYAVPRADVVGAENDSGSLRGWSCRLQEVAQDVVADGGEARLRVELHALDRIQHVADGHDDAAVGLRRDLQLFVREPLALDGQRVVTDRLERVGEAAEDAGAVVVDHAGLAVHDLGGAGDDAAERLADRLAAPADTQEGDAPSARPEPW